MQRHLDIPTLHFAIKIKSPRKEQGKSYFGKFSGEEKQTSKTKRERFEKGNAKRHMESIFVCLKKLSFIKIYSLRKYFKLGIRFY